MKLNNFNLIINHPKNNHCKNMKSEKKTQEEKTEAFTCVICSEEKEHYTTLNCNHSSICYYCTLKCRTFYNDLKCPLCNLPSNLAFISPVSQEHLPYNILSKNIDDYYQDDDFEKNSIYYTDITSQEAALELKMYKCPITVCIAEPFDTFDKLKSHLSSAHEKFYCDICVKDNKKFIHEQEIFTSKELKNHIKYGDVLEPEGNNDNNGIVLMTMPHPRCKFCHSLFFDEEKLNKHLNENHFLCEICKKQSKKVLFYSVLRNLTAHSKMMHYCCPVRECVDDLYVAFGNEEELVLHLITKHQQVEGSKSCKKLINDSRPRIIVDPKSFDLQISNDEFDIKTYMEMLNTEATKYHENIRRNKYQDINKYDNKYIHHEVVFVDINAIEPNQGNFYNDDDNNNGVRYYKQQFRRFKQQRQLDFQNIKQSYNSQYYKNINPNEMSSGYYISGHTINSNIDTQNDPKNTKPKIDYKFIFTFYKKLIKKAITSRIKKDEIPEEEVKLPRDTIFQMIIIIDKIESPAKLLELTFIQNFGVSSEIIAKLKSYLSKADDINEDKFLMEIDTLPTKTLLIIYKYIYISRKKVLGEFYKVDYEDVEEELYGDFMKSKKKNDWESNVDKRNEYPDIKFKKYKNKKKKYKWDQRKPIGLIGGSKAATLENNQDKVPKVVNINEKVNNKKEEDEWKEIRKKGAKKSTIPVQVKEEPKQLKETKKEDSEDEKDNDEDDGIASKSKLAQLLSNDKTEKLMYSKPSSKLNTLFQDRSYIENQSSSLTQSNTSKNVGKGKKYKSKKGKFRSIDDCEIYL